MESIGCSKGGRRRGATGKKTRKMRGGNMVGFGIDAGLGSAGAARPAMPNVAVDKAGTPLPDYTMPGGRRRRRGKKTRKSRKGGRRGRKTMRGGASYAGSANSGASFGGKGIGGMATYDEYAANVPGSGGTSTQVAGVWSA